MPGLAQLGQGGNACSHSQGIAREGSGLVHSSDWSNLLHDLATPTVGPYGEATANDFPQAGQVGSDTFPFLHAAQGNTEAGHDLVED